MESLTTFERWYGRDEPPAEIVKLRAGEASLRRLNADTAATAATDRAAFLERWERYPMHDGRADLVLAPYETAFIEIRHT